MKRQKGIKKGTGRLFTACPDMSGLPVHVSRHLQYFPAEQDQL
jgi:hypothetical protein